MLMIFNMAAGRNENTAKKKSKNTPKRFWKGADKNIRTGNKKTGHAFVEARKRKALKEYKKLLKKAREENSAAQDFPPSEESSAAPKTPAPTRKRKNLTRFTAAEREFKKTKQERIQQIKEHEEERKKKVELQKQKLKERRQNFNRLNKRTRKGQPVMAGQIEHLLQKIQT